jgi:hypothetical protein
MARLDPAWYTPPNAGEVTIMQELDATRESALVKAHEAGMMDEDAESPKLYCGGMVPPALTSPVNAATSASNSGISMDEDAVFCLRDLEEVRKKKKQKIGKFFRWPKFI